jgi:hypothetical protein
VERPPGLVLRLGPGEAFSGPEAAPAGTGRALTAAETTPLLARLPALPAGPPASPGGETSRASERPAPPEDPATLTVIHRSPEGEVEDASAITVHFSTPMVGPGTDAELATPPLPLTVTPSLPGVWRWLGPRTLVLEPAGHRLPRASAFTVELAAGVRARSGARLARPVRWRFRTPPPRVVDCLPRPQVPVVHPVILVSFDQAVDPRGALAVIRLSGGGRSPGLRLATPADLGRAPEVRERLRAAARSGRSSHLMALVPTERLEPSTDFTVSIGPGTPSAEGPEQRPGVHRCAFRTEAPFRLVRALATPGRAPHPAAATLTLGFSRLVLPASVTASALRITPAIPDLRITVLGPEVVLSGRTRGRTTYAITVPTSIQDLEGRHLDLPQTREVAVEAPATTLLTRHPRFATLPASPAPAYRFQSTGIPRVRVEVHAVTAADLAPFLAATGVPPGGPAPALPGRRLIDREEPVSGGEEPVETRVELAPHLGAAGTGQLVVRVSELGPGPPATRRSLVSWVQVTRLDVEAHVDATRLLARVTELASGAPVRGASVTVLPDARAVTDASGLAWVALPDAPPAGPSVLAVQAGDDLALLPETTAPRVTGRWRRLAPSRRMLRWSVVSDRPRYRPGDTVQLKGWLRRSGVNGRSDLRLVGLKGSSVTYRAADPLGLRLAQGTAPVSRAGGFDLRFTLPRDVREGLAMVTLTSDVEEVDLGHSWAHEVRIEAAAAASGLTVRTSAPELVVGDHADVAAVVARTDREPHGGAEVTWQVETRPARFSPPGRSGFTFVGPETAWAAIGAPATQLLETWRGRTTLRGSHVLRLQAERADPARPYRVRATATLADSSTGQPARSIELLVHPARAVLGLRRPRAFGRRGEPERWEVLVTDLAGAPLPDRPYVIETLGPGGARVTRTRCEGRSGASIATCDLTLSEPGVHVVRGQVTDAEGRISQTVLLHPVGGGPLPAAPDDDAPRVVLTADQAEHLPGTTAEVLVQSTLDHAEGLMILRREGLLDARRFGLRGGTAQLRIPVTGDHAPGLDLEVHLLGTPKGTGALPVRATGRLTLLVPPRHHRLDLSLTTPPGRVRPGSRLLLELAVKDAKGAPAAGAEVTLLLTEAAPRRRAPAPRADALLGAFHPAVAPDIETRRLHEPPEREARAPRPADDARPPALASGAWRPATDPQLTPTITTDEMGRARMFVTLPEPARRYRIAGWAVAGASRFGQASLELDARPTLELQLLAPPIVTRGDAFALPVIVQSRAAGPLEVRLAARAAGLSLTGEPGRTVSLAPGDRREVLLAVRADQEGTARIQVLAAADGAEAVASVTLQIRPSDGAARGAGDAIEQGLAVARRYEAVDDPRDVERNAAGQWRLRRGARVRVVVSLASAVPRGRVSLTDDLPAGLVPVAGDPREGPPTDAPDDRPSLRFGTDPGRHRASARRRERRTWFDRLVLGDARVEASASALPAGAHEIRYLARAVFPGTFSAPPARAAETLRGEVQGQTAAAIVVVSGTHPL